MSKETKSRLYKTQALLKRRLRIAYPAGNGRMVLRTELDWDKDVAPIETSDDGSTWTFELEADHPFLYFKPCLIRDDEFHWSIGPNKLLLMEESDKRISYPHFFSSAISFSFMSTFMETTARDSAPATRPDGQAALRLCNSKTAGAKGDGQ